MPDEIKLEIVGLADLKLRKKCAGWLDFLVILDVMFCISQSFAYYSLTYYSQRGAKHSAMGRA